jgi:hypothetical protein
MTVIAIHVLLAVYRSASVLSTYWSSPLPSMLSFLYIQASVKFGIPMLLVLLVLIPTYQVFLPVLLPAILGRGRQHYFRM